MNKLSIKLRVTIWYTIAMIFVSVIALAAVASFSQKILMRDCSVKIVRAVNDFAHGVAAPQRNDRPAREFRRGEPGVYFMIYDSEHNQTGGGMSFEFINESHFTDEKLTENTYNGNKYLSYTKRVNTFDGDTCWVIGVISLAAEGSMIRSVIKTNVIIIIMLIIAAGAGGYLIIRHALKPVDKISRTARAISESSDLSQRISLGGGRDEIYRLADTFDDMLDKIEKNLENEKQFTSDASHELRTPVAVINSECEYIIDCADDLEEAKESVLSIKRQSDKMSRLISELLTISRMDKNTQKINFESTDISELLSIVCDEQEEIHNENITLIRSISAGVTADADRMLLTRLFINLISNAYQYGKDGGRITVTLENDADNIIFSVADNGIGISAEELPRIWERFYQADPSRTNKNGSLGLGLSMVKLIAEYHKGTITVNSTPGEGTTFRLIMPKKQSG